MIIGIGVDLVKISRIQAITERWGPVFLNRIFTPAEQRYCLRHRFPHRHLAARFAMKEAVLKALGIGIRFGVKWSEIETVNHPNGGPQVIMYGKVRKLADERDVLTVYATITHDDDYAIAQVILQR